MKFLQITNIAEPRILEMGKDFDIVHLKYLIQANVYINKREDIEIQFFPGKKVCLLSDCYKSRPLIEIDGYTEFDLIEGQQNDTELLIFKIDDYTVGHEFDGYTSHVKSIGFSISKETYSSNLGDGFWVNNLGSIFTPENKLKYLELYQKAYLS